MDPPTQPSPSWWLLAPGTLELAASASISPRGSSRLFPAAGGFCTYLGLPGDGCAAGKSSEPRELGASQFLQGSLPYKGGISFTLAKKTPSLSLGEDSRVAVRGALVEPEFKLCFPPLQPARSLKTLECLFYSPHHQEGRKRSLEIRNWRDG